MATSDQIAKLQAKAAARYNQLAQPGVDVSNIWETDPELVDLHNQVSSLQSANGMTYNPATGTYSPSEGGASSLGGSRENSPSISGLIDSLMGQKSPSAEDIRSSITGMAGERPNLISGISYEEGLGQASDSLNPLYEIKSKKMLGNLAADQVNRGFYGQLPADVVTQEAVGNLEAEKNANISSLASTLVNNSAQNANQANSLALNAYQNDVSAAIAALNSSGSAESDRFKNIVALLGMQNDDTIADRNFGLETRKLNIDEGSQSMKDALARTELLGYVSDSDSSILGVPAGTTTEAAKYHQQSLAASAARSSAKAPTAAEQLAAKRARYIDFAQRQLSSIPWDDGAGSYNAYIAARDLMNQELAMSSLSDNEYDDILASVAKAVGYQIPDKPKSSSTDPNELKKALGLP